MRRTRSVLLALLLAAGALAGCTDEPDEQAPSAPDNAIPGNDGSPPVENETNPPIVVPTYTIADGDSITLEHQSNAQDLKTFRFRLTVNETMRLNGWSSSTLNNQFLGIGMRPVEDEKVDWLPPETCDDEMEFPLNGNFNRRAIQESFREISPGTHEVLVATQTERFSTTMHFRAEDQSSVDDERDPVEHSIEWVPTQNKWTIRTQTQEFNAEGDPPNSQANVATSMALPTAAYFFARLDWNSIESDWSANLAAGSPVCASASDEGGITQTQVQANVDLVVQGALPEGSHDVKGHIDGDTGTFNGGELELVWMHPA